jgi:hypothetical protein
LIPLSHPLWHGRRFRETFNWYHNDADYGLDVNAADLWIEAGWNVGVLYWNQHADEVMMMMMMMVVVVLSCGDHEGCGATRVDDDAYDDKAQDGGGAYDHDAYDDKTHPLTASPPSRSSPRTRSARSGLRTAARACAGGTSTRRAACSTSSPRAPHRL